MACRFLHHRHGFSLFFGRFGPNRLPDQTVSQYKCYTKCTSHVSSRFRKTQKLSATKSSNNVPRKANSLVTDDRDGGCECDPDPGPELDDVSGGSVSGSFSALVHRLGRGFKLDGLGMEILSIALPATLALAADPIASLVDTAYVGHLGSAELAAVGVSGAVFNLVSKLFNVPLLNITTSFVAEEQASVKKVPIDFHQSDQDQQSKTHLPSVSTSLMLAAALGVIETVALSTGSGFLLNCIGFTNAHAS